MAKTQGILHFKEKLRAMVKEKAGKSKSKIFSE